jgi:hypothetical protein
MDYIPPDKAERWLRENDPDFGKGERPYLSQFQIGYRGRKETPVNPNTIDRVDFSGANTGNYGTKGQLRILQKDRHKRAKEF